MNITIRAARREDVESLSGRLREADTQEVLALGRELGIANVAGVMERDFQRSQSCHTVELDGLPVAMFGVVEDADALPGSTILAPMRSANVWLLGTPELAKIKKSFLKISRQIFAEWMKKYTLVWNLVDASYTKTFRWLKACGAQFGTSHKLGGKTFVFFAMARRA